MPAVGVKKNIPISARQKSRPMTSIYDSDEDASTGSDDETESSLSESYFSKAKSALSPRKNLGSHSFTANKRPPKRRKIARGSVGDKLELRRGGSQSGWEDSDYVETTADEQSELS